MEELRRSSQAGTAATEKPLRAIREDARIADGLRDVWKHQNSGAEPFYSGSEE